MRFFLSLFLMVTLFGKNSDCSYAIATGEQDHERLIILNDLYNSSSIAHLEIAPNIRILTLGCGIGLLELEIAKKMNNSGLILATDISYDQLAIAEKTRAKQHVNNLQFLQMSIEDISRIPGQFDRIHCRFVLSHMPWGKIIKIIPILYSKLTPGGFFLLEEIATLKSLTCEPFSNPGYDKWIAIFYKQFAAQQSDTSIGEKLFKHLQKEGFSVSYSSHQPILYTPREKSILTMGVRSVTEKLLQKNLVSQDEIEDTITLLEELEQNSTLYPKYCEISQIILRK